MIFDLITIVAVGLILLFAGYTALQFLGKFPRRTMEDVTPYLRPAEFEELESLLNPAHEVNFRLRLSPREFREWQRRRIHLLREYLLRMSHNSLVLIEWGNMELDGNGSPSHKSGEVQALAQELVQAATEFRLYSLLALAKLKFWIVFRLDASASLPRLRTVLGIDAMAAYKRLKSAAGTLGMAHGTEYHQQLLARL
jgi:hypothetical protein